MTTRSPHADSWTLDPSVTFLNHGSFGACPQPILELQAEYRARMERQPVLFLHREFETLLDEARAAVGTFVGADPDDLAFVANATTGVNTVLRSLAFEPGDQLLVTNLEYNATRNVVDYVAGRAGCEVVVVDVPFPVASADVVLERILAATTERTRLAVVDHITSQTGSILPIDRLVPALRERGVEVLVDGAHAPGMLPLDLEALGADYYTGNFHKWVCAPKGAAMLWVRRDRQAGIRPAVVSHGANSPRDDRSRFRIEADWVGTVDPTAWLCVPECIRFLGSLFPDGWAGLRAHNRRLVLDGRAALCSALDIEPPCPEDMIGSLASVPLPDRAPGPFVPPLFLDELQQHLWDDHRIEVPIMFWPAPPHRLLRISGQAYNDASQYRRLADALRAWRQRDAAIASADV